MTGPKPNLADLRAWSQDGAKFDYFPTSAIESGSPSSLRKAPKMSTNEDAKKARAELPRKNLPALLESYGFGDYESEPTEDLREAVLKEFLAGGIEASGIFQAPLRLPDPRDR